MADLVDEGQATGQIAAHGGDRKSRLEAPTLKDLGISTPKLSEARAIRDAFSAEEIEAGQRLGPNPGAGAPPGHFMNPGSDSWPIPPQRVQELRRFYGHRDFLIELVRIDVDDATSRIERKVTPSATFSSSEKRNRSEERAVAEWFDANSDWERIGARAGVQEGTTRPGRSRTTGARGESTSREKGRSALHDLRRGASFGDALPDQEVLMGSNSRSVTVGLYRGVKSRIEELADYDDAERLALDAVRATADLAVIRDELGIMVAAFDCEGRSWRRGSEPAATVAEWGDFLDRHQIDRRARGRHLLAERARWNMPYCWCWWP